MLSIFIYKWKELFSQQSWTSDDIPWARRSQATRANFDPREWLQFPSSLHLPSHPQKAFMVNRALGLQCPCPIWEHGRGSVRGTGLPAGKHLQSQLLWAPPEQRLRGDFISVRSCVLICKSGGWTPGSTRSPPLLIANPSNPQWDLQDRLNRHVRSFSFSIFDNIWNVFVLFCFLKSYFLYFLLWKCKAGNNMPTLKKGKMLAPTIRWDIDIDIDINSLIYWVLSRWQICAKYYTVAIAGLLL